MYWIFSLALVNIAFFNLSVLKDEPQFYSEYKSVRLPVDGFLRENYEALFRSH